MLYYTFDDIIKIFLFRVKSCEFTQMNDVLLLEYLESSVSMAIASFRYPKISLEYTQIDSYTNSGEPYSYYQFINPIRQEEANVILAIMLKDWYLTLSLNTNMYQNSYYDGNIKTHSVGNILGKIRDLTDYYTQSAKTAQYDYSRITFEHSPNTIDYES